MLSDEEKQSIESLKNIAIYIGDNYTFSQQGIRNLRENLRIVLPAIEKQSKEIEHWKAGMKIIEKDKNNHIERLEKEIEDHIENKELINQTLGLEKNANINKTLEKIIILNNYEDKIKAKIEDLKENSNGDDFNLTNVIMFFKSLLEKE